MVASSSCCTAGEASVWEPKAQKREPTDVIILAGNHHADFRAYQPLSDRYRILGFDFRGHGQSSCSPPYSFKQLVEDIEAFREHFAGGEKAVVAGGSFGGFLAQQVRMVLVCAAAADGGCSTPSRTRTRYRTWFCAALRLPITVSISPDLRGEFGRLTSAR